jgi:hypothetical protein
MPFSILADKPATKDLLNFDRYCDPLVELLTSDGLQTPLTIGIFGSWGSGKSTLLGMLESRLGDLGQQQKFLCVKFNPWIFRKEKNLLIPLLHAIRDAMSESFGGKFKESAARISDVLLHIGADVLLRHITAGKVTLDNLDKYEKAYLERKGLIDSQLRNLRETLAAQARKLHESGTILVLLIDDLDRCDPTEMLDLLESLKLFLDVEHVVHILAVDKEVIDRGVEVKYGKYVFANDRKATLGAEYLEKMIQIPVYLFPLHEEQVRGFIRANDLSLETSGLIDLLTAGLSPNPRKIKRVLNSIAFTRHAIGHEQPDWRIVASLGIMRVEQPELYADLARLPLLLIALQHVYARDWSTSDNNRFVALFGDKSAFAQERCLAWYKPASPLAALFAVDFNAAKDRLAEYVSVVGGR